MKRTLFPVIDTNRCTGCGWCVPACHLHLLSLAVQGWQKFSTLHDAQDCTGCRKCEVKCPFEAITMACVAPLAEEDGANADLRQTLGQITVGDAGADPVQNVAIPSAGEREFLEGAQHE